MHCSLDVIVTAIKRRINIFCYSQLRQSRCRQTSSKDQCSNRMWKTCGFNGLVSYIHFISKFFTGWIHYYHYNFSIGVYKSCCEQLSRNLMNL